MSARRAPLLAATIAVAAFGLTACFPTPSAPEEPAAETTAPETSAPAETEEPAESEAAGAPAGDVAAPGAEFAFDEPATLELTNTDDQVQLINITITGQREGALADFEAAGADEEFMASVAAYTPIYVEYEVTKAEPFTAEIAYNDISGDFGAIDQSGEDLEMPILIGFDTCDASSFESEVDEGAAQTGCIVVLARDDQELAGVTYGEYGTAYDDFDGQPVVWRP